MFTCGKRTPPGMLSGFSGRGRFPAVRPIAVFLLAALPLVAAPKFYEDDPLVREPEPLPVLDAQPRKLSDIYDLFSHLFASVGERTLGKSVPARDVNTLGEVMDGAWYEMRHYRHRMSLRDLATGPGVFNAPAETGQWTVISAKTEGVTPGFVIEDETKKRYFIKFDPLHYPELTTAADVISSKIFHALGYHVPENYIVHFDKERLKLGSKATVRDARGLKRALTWQDINEILLRTPNGEDGRFRATASFFVPGKILNEYRYYGTRSDDPNDTIPHEHRRSLRGLHVFCAWLQHEDSRAINTLDSLVEENGKKYIKHYLLDFGSTLGSASSAPNSPRSGFEQFFTWKSAAKQFFTLGLYVPNWARIHYPDLPGVGRFSSQFFDPVHWTPEYPNPAFQRREPEDTFWAARQVMHFTDEEIRAMVRTGEYSSPKSERYVADTLIKRRDAIGRAYLAKPLQLDRFRVEDGAVQFDDLAVKYGFLPEQNYVYSWFEFNNETEQRTALAGAASTTIPATNGRWLAMDISSAKAGNGNESGRVSIYLKRADSGRFTIVGIDRAST